MFVQVHRVRGLGLIFVAGLGGYCGLGDPTGDNLIVEADSCSERQRFKGEPQQIV